MDRNTRIHAGLLAAASLINPEHLAALDDMPAEESSFPPRLAHAVQSEFVPRTEHPPRNSLCPCGSGKKYKKCCLK